MENFQAHTAVLREIIKQHPQATGPLPPLVADTSAWDEFWRKVGDWIVNFLHALNPNIDTSGLANFLRPLIYVFLAALVIVLIYSIVKSYAGRRRVKQAGGAEPMRVMTQSHAERLAAALDEALARGDYSLAARLRWKLFLFRGGQDETSTPFEIFGFNEPAAVSPFYELMFGFKTGMNLYKDLDEALVNRERNGAMAGAP